jgi:hypothetical protein
LLHIQLHYLPRVDLLIFNAFLVKITTVSPPNSLLQPSRVMADYYNSTRHKDAKNKVTLAAIASM